MGKDHNMCFKLIIAIFLTIFLASAALGGDLYLLRIDNKESLKIAEETIDHAYGTLDNRFIVELNARQLGILQRAGIEIELIKSKWTPDQTYLINRMHPEMAAKMPAVRALYASEKGTLAELSAADVDNLRKEYFLVVPIADKKTPLFYTPVIIPSYYRDVFPNDSLANRINQDSIYANNLRLEQFRTRYIYTDSCYAARDWIISKFHSYGYTDVYYDSFDYYGRICNNVICRKPGVADPDNTIVVGGHYDSINQDSDPNYYAPGADDNGSGVAAVLELARVLKDIPLKKSVMFIAFSAEEVGLVGSYVAASNLYYSGTKVEFMLNFDMIGFTADAQPDVTYFYGFSSAYAQILGQAALRVTDLQPFYGGHAGNSDHASFDQFGFFTAYVQEGDFNTAGWHHDADVTARMDFPYMAKELKMSVAALGQIDLAASPTAIDNVFDAGDGQGLLVAWDSNCKPEYTYKVMYGIQTGIYTDTIDVPPATCSYDLSGLTLGQKYYLTVLGVNPEGHGPVYTMEASATPYEIPQAPDNFEADPDMGRIHLIWRANKELDLNHYCLYRRIQGGSWGVLQDNLSDTAFSDTTALPHISFEYVVCAVDNDGNYSDSSDISGATMASFDGGVLFVEETSSGGMDPTNEQQEAYYDSILGGEVYTKYYVDSSGEALSRSIAGQYGSIIWIDDDVSTHLFLNGQDSIRWYLG